MENPVPLAHQPQFQGSVASMCGSRGLDGTVKTNSDRIVAVASSPIAPMTPRVTKSWEWSPRPLSAPPTLPPSFLPLSLLRTLCPHVTSSMFLRPPRTSLTSSPLPLLGLPPGCPHNSTPITSPRMPPSQRVLAPPVCSELMTPPPWMHQFLLPSTSDFLAVS